MYASFAKRSVPIDEIAEVGQDKGPTPEQAASRREGSDRLQRALAALPDEYREVLVLKHIEELGYEEIAAITGVSIAALKVRAHRGRDMLRRALGDGEAGHGQ